MINTTQDIIENVKRGGKKPDELVVTSYFMFCMYYTPKWLNSFSSNFLDVFYMLPRISPVNFSSFSPAVQEKQVNTANNSSYMKTIGDVRFSASSSN